MDNVKRVGRVSITSDDDIAGCLCKPGFISPTISFSFLKDNLSSFVRCDFPGLILGITINDENLEVPCMFRKIVSVHRVNSFTNTAFFVDCGDNNTDFQIYSLQVRV